MPSGHLRYLKGHRVDMYRYLLLCAIAFQNISHGQQNPPLRLATFSADITIPLGHRCMGILPTKASRIEDPLEAKGVVFLSDQQPVVFVALDWCEVRNGAYDQWRDRIAAAVGSTRQRIVVCSLHQHDAPVTDSGAQRLLDSVGLENELYDTAFQDECIDRVVDAMKQALSNPQVVTHYAATEAKVDRIASTRRVRLPDGHITFDRGSSSASQARFADADEGEIDPFLKTLRFFNDQSEIASISSYATHPMSYYGRGGVTADFVGLARRRRQMDTPGTMQIYASGCSGDVTAGKYNDGSPAMRGVLADRLYDAMHAASQSNQRTPLESFAFRCEAFQLPFHEGEEFERNAMTKVLWDSEADVRDRILAAMGLSSLDRIESGQAIDLPCLDFGKAQLVLLPGEAFVGYQLIAQSLRPDSFVMAIGYGECWPGYIPTKQAFDEGFNHGWRWVGRGSEGIIRDALQNALSPK
ncbi:MAG: hypothetical protein R3C05_08960 [Pirellulaceae bacterium]